MRSTVTNPTEDLLYRLKAAGMTAGFAQEITDLLPPDGQRALIAELRDNEDALQELGHSHPFSLAHMFRTETYVADHIRVLLRTVGGRHEQGEDGRRYEVTLTPADVDSITAGSTVSVNAAPGVTIELISEDAWQGPSGEPGVYRCGLSDREISWLRVRHNLTILPVGIDESVLLTLDPATVTR